MSASLALVDTDIVSFLARDHSIAVWYQEALSDRPLAISIVSVAEIEYGMESRGWVSYRRRKMRRVLERFTPLATDPETAYLWAGVRTECEKKGRPIGFAEAWIAATALQLNIPLITHNPQNYEGIELLKLITARSLP